MPQNAYAPALQGLRQLGQGVDPNATDDGIGTPIPGSELMQPGDFNTTKPGMAPGTMGTVDPAVTDLLFQKKLGDEFKDRLTSNIRAGGDPNEIAGLHRLLGLTQQDIAENPLTAQRQQVDAITARDQAAHAAGFGSQPSVSSPAQEQVQFQRNLAAQERALEVEKMRQPAAIEAMKEKAATDRNTALTNALASGNIQPGTTLGLGNGASVRIAPTPPMAAGAVTDIQKKIDSLLDQSRAIDSDPVAGAQDFLAHLGTPGVRSKADRKKAIQDQIDKLQAQLPARPGAPGRPAPTGGGSNPLRDRAVSELQRAGHPTTEANINYVISQLSK